MIRHKNRCARGDAQGNRIGRAGVDFDGSPVQAQMYPCVEDVMSQVAYNYLFYPGVEILNNIGQQIVRHRAGRLDALESAVDRENLDDADYDRKTPLAVPFLENDHLLIGHLIYDYAR